MPKHNSNVAVIFRLLCFRLTKGRATYFRSETIFEFLAPYSVVIRSVIQSFLKTPICGASLSYYTLKCLSEFRQMYPNILGLMRKITT